jgi:hypothetical protein
MRCRTKSAYSKFIAQQQTNTMEIKISATDSIYVLSAPFSLRLNKLAGMFATSTIDLSEPLTVAAYGRGKQITLAPVAITTGLYGSIGKSEEKEWSHVLGVIVSAEHPALPRGLVVEFICYGYERQAIEQFNLDAELAAILEQNTTPKLIDIKFDKHVTTQHGSVIKPPSIHILDCPKEDLELANAARELWDSHPEVAVDPTLRYPGLALAFNKNIPALAAASAGM